MEEKAKLWDTITQVVSRREKRGKTCCCGCCRARQSVLLVDWEDHAFDLIGCPWSDVWCDWLQRITCLMWLEVHPRVYHLRNGSTVRSRNKLFKNSSIRILFCFIFVFYIYIYNFNTVNYWGFICFIGLLPWFWISHEILWLACAKLVIWCGQKRELKCPHCQLYSVIHTSIHKLKMEIIFLLSPQATFLIYDKRERLKNLPVLSDDNF